MVLPVNSSGNKDYNNFEIYEKSVWLFILLLMILNFFYIKPIGTLILIGRGIVFLAMELLWLLSVSPTIKQTLTIHCRRLLNTSLSVCCTSLSHTVHDNGYKPFNQNLDSESDNLPHFFSVPRDSGVFHVVPSEKDVIKGMYLDSHIDSCHHNITYLHRAGTLLLKMYV